MRNKYLILVLLTVILNFLSPHTTYAENLSPNKQCLSCHGKKDYLLIWHNKKIDISVNGDHYNFSIHGTYSCVKCHIGITPDYPHSASPIFGHELGKKASEGCAYCHKEAAKDFNQSAHFDKVNCNDCHGSHQIYKRHDQRTLVNRVNISKMCMKCHDGEVKEAYMESFHGKANSLGSENAASCADCHGSHFILSPKDPISMVSKLNVAKTCSKCHITAEANFAIGQEHTVIKNKPGSAPMYWTIKFFVWLTVIVISLLFVHMEMELYRILKQTKGR